MRPVTRSQHAARARPLSNGDSDFKLPVPRRPAAGPGRRARTRNSSSSLAQWPQAGGCQPEARVKAASRTRNLQCPGIRLRSDAAAWQPTRAGAGNRDRRPRDSVTRNLNRGSLSRIRSESVTVASVSHCGGATVPVLSLPDSEADAGPPPRRRATGSDSHQWCTVTAAPAGRPGPARPAPEHRLAS